MKKIVNLTFIVLATTVSSYAQYDMGDPELNGWLTTIVGNAKIHFSEFRSYITGNYEVSGNRYDYLQSEVGMNEGDIYLMAEITKVSHKSLEDVITAYKRDKKQGWGAIAKGFGVTPGSAAFESLKDHAYKKANGTSRPKPKPVVASKPATKPAKKTTAKTTTKTTTKSKSTTKTVTKPVVKPKTTKKT